MNTVQPIREISDINRMKAALTNDRDRLLFIIGINSGLRVSDILTLKVGDVRGRNYIVVTEKKTGKSRQFVVNQSIRDAVATLLPSDVSDDDYLFPSRKGYRPITRVTAYRILNEAAEGIGLIAKYGAIGCHSLRKTMGFHAYKNGVDLALIQSILNHASQRETLRYIGITQDQVDDVFMAINL